MNRILFEREEIVDGVATFGGVRAEHVLKVLHGEVGQIIKTGEINGLIGTSEIVAIDGGVIKALVTHDTASLAPWVDLILAPPRPRVMKRLLPQLATMGVGRIMLVGAEKVERDFWGATLLKEENYRPLLIDGLMQAGTSILPTLETYKSFRRFLRDTLPTLAHTNRIVAHPYSQPSTLNSQPSTLNSQPSTLNLNLSPQHPRSSLLLAIGPEGGWTDAEVGALEGAGFVRYSLGSRILRTDTATIALLARLEP